MSEHSIPHWRIPFEGLTNNLCLGQGSAGIIFAISDEIAIKVPLQYDPVPNDKLGFYEFLSRRSSKCLEKETKIYDLLSERPHKNVIRRIHGSPRKCLFLERAATNVEAEFRKGSVDLATRERWIAQLVDAIAWLERLELSHGDLRPNNLLVDGKRDLKLCDFDQTAPISAQTRREDQFNLGSCIFFISTGEKPYPDLQEPERNQRLQDRDYPAFENSFSKVIDKCWQGEYASYGPLQAEIEGVRGIHAEADLDVSGVDAVQLRQECIAWLEKAVINEEWVEMSDRAEESSDDDEESE